MASTNLSRANGSGSATTKFTYSVWLKYSGWVAGGQRFFSSTGGSGDTYFRFNEDGTMEISGHNSGATSLGYFVTNRKFRDHSAWYHIVIKSDTTQSTQADRFKLYINGVQETSFSTGTYPNQNSTDNTSLSSNTHYIGGTVSSQYFNGSMSHVHYCDGYAYDASTFGSTDATSGIWKINTSPSVSYGTNGYWILKDGATLTDSSSNSNNFSLANGTLTKTQDCPDNNFATMNPLDNYFPSFTFSNGNTTVTTGGNFSYPQATIYVNTGKFYWECKPVSKAGGGEEYMIGIQGRSATAINQPAQGNNGYTMYGTDGNIYGWGATASYGSAYTAGDIVGVALDCTNNKLYWSKNGAWMGSGNPSTGSNGYSINAANTTAQGGYSPVAGFYDSPAAVFNFNFGNGHFGTTAVTTNSGNGYAGTDGKSIFNYQPPTGYSALSTKGLNL